MKHYGLAVCTASIESDEILGAGAPGLSVSFGGQPLALGAVARIITFPLWFQRNIQCWFQSLLMGYVSNARPI
jgi:hypothetical protein